ncbi:hypothetical protein SERLA73DRAFT_186433 [Serpula lacrymans var. lacrymans S7.3]|uniref:Uncharacterized protein n=2 Tax=Serpula lacrymans var. lacrymans TaxID=341189 RepID=F8Q796_SERL3|nr:uncharacterized protein SERLADRAFT_475466 [Serpula lacrymans var. lacrymans S7.9]EGN95434.1 hypothetical protein SERLA73DRAFT_186433 [Serpula lacrymans var. lacrymans S7.3]EGO20966.1 hypothetical protein SERLADRAFT_475466 [Serpula lacrymans var. lacrymans S7.9]
MNGNESNDHHGQGSSTRKAWLSKEAGHSALKSKRLERPHMPSHSAITASFTVCKIKSSNGATQG